MKLKSLFTFTILLVSLNLLAQLPDTVYWANGKVWKTYTDTDSGMVEFQHPLFEDNVWQISQCKVVDGKVILHGRYKNLFPDGQVLQLGRIENGFVNGPVIGYYKNGRINFKYSKTKDVLNGPFREFYEDGTLKIFGEYASGFRDGKWTWYRNTGEIGLRLKYKPRVSRPIVLQGDTTFNPNADRFKLDLR